MNSFKIVKMNFKNNIKTYSLYIMSMVFAVATYYNFWNLNFNPQVNSSKELSGYIKSTAGMTTIFMVIFLIFFIAYSSKFFLNERKREIGLYAFMGIDNYKIGWIFASEGLFLGGLSLVLGLLFGVAFSKLFMMLLGKIAILDIVFKFNISIKAIGVTVLTFGIIFILTFIKGYIDIIRMSLIDLMEVNKRDEKEPSLNYLKGFLSIVVLGLAYYVALKYKKFGFGLSLNLAVLLVIVGTYWFFGAFFTLILKRLIGRKSLLYKGVNIVSLTNIFFRIKDNFRTLAAVTVLITSCITSLATVSSIKYFVDENHHIEVPYTISYIEESKKDEEKIDRIINKLGYDKKLDEEINFIASENYNYINYSNFENLLKDLEVEKAEKILSKLNLDKGTVGYVEAPGVMLSIMDKKEDILLDDGLYQVSKSMKLPTFGKLLGNATIVFSDEKYKELTEKYEESLFKGIILEENKKIDHEKLTLGIYEEFKGEKEIFTKYLADMSSYNVAGIVYFLGLFLAFVLMFATGSILYFKILSESFKEQNKFKILKNIGTTGEEIKDIVEKQVEILYKLPFLIAIVHSSVAIYVLSMMMEYPLYLPMAASVLIFAIVLYIYSKFTIKKYLEVVDN